MTFHLLVSSLSYQLLTPTEHFALRSSRVPLQTNYSIGVFKDDGLHLTPIHKLYQMRPDFNALDERDKAKEKRKEEMKLARLKSEGKAPSESITLKPAQVHFVQQESDRSKWIREHSWSYLKALEDEEPFQHLQSSGRVEDMESDCFEKLYYQDEASPYEVPWNLSPKMYLSAINPQVLSDSTFLDRYEDSLHQLNSSSDRPSQNLAEPEYSLHQIKMMPIVKKIAQILKKIQITQFYSLLKLIEEDESDEVEVLKHLTQSGVLVCGVFVYKTSKMPLGSYEQALRNFALLKFTTEGKLSSDELLNDFGIPPRVVQNLLAPIGVCTNGLWTLKVSMLLFFLTF